MEIVYLVVGLIIGASGAIIYLQSRQQKRQQEIKKELQRQKEKVIAPRFIGRKVNGYGFRRSRRFLTLDYCISRLKYMVTRFTLSLGLIHSSIRIPQ